ncbi:MAG: 2-dehydropantoate 2-reductase, partial [Gemmatimonadota bacterium]|nr:2-dehydropantoate 2-reductase [Gemmatimonadota bacterium]
MRILVVGAGALGGFVGAGLSRIGADVTLFTNNAARAALLDTAGLRITSVGQDEISVPVHVVTSVEGLAAFDLVFVAVKTYQTEDALEAVLAATGPGTRFLTMQNGIGNAERIAAMVGAERVLVGITYHSIQ